MTTEVTLSDCNKPELIQSLWIGTSLSLLERLCLESFLYHGHHFQLYVYEQPAGVPKGIELMDAESILPRSSIFKYTDRNTYAGFSNLFRYKLLFEKGNIWIDMDLICLVPFQFHQLYVFASEFQRSAANCMIKVPANSNIMQFCYEQALKINTQAIRWGQTGPSLLATAVKHTGLQKYVKNHNAFCPINYWEYDLFTAEDSCDSLSGRIENSYAIHLWNEMWRINKLDKNLKYPATSLYESLKNRYLYRDMKQFLWSKIRAG